MKVISSGFIVGDRIVSLAFSTHPDWSAGFGRRNGFSFVGASAIGKLHLRDGKGREDCFLIRSRGDWLLLLVADGVGSARLGGWGATLAVAFFAEELLSMLSVEEGETILFERRRPRGHDLSLSFPVVGEGVGTLSWYRPVKYKESAHPIDEKECIAWVTNAFEKTHRFLLGIAQKENCSPGTLATTLLGVLFHTSSKKGVAFQLGDGLILEVTRKESRPVVVGREFEVGETAVLTQSNWQEWYQVAHFTWHVDTKAVLLMTDGVADDCLYGPPHDLLHRFGSDIVKELKRFKNEEVVACRLVDWLGHYKAPASFDDRTLLALYR